MRAIHARALALVITSATLTACSLQIEEQDFEPSVDADTTDAPPAGIELVPSPLAVTEGGTAVLTVRTTLQLEGDVTVSLTADATLTLSTTSVVLGPSQTMATVNVTALDDDDAVPGEANVNAQATGLGTASALVQIAEDDTLEFQTDQDTVTITEGASTMVQVRLKARPLGDLTVSVASGDVLIASVAPATLFFGTNNWDVYQSVTIAGSVDPDAEHDSIGVTFSATGVPPKTVQANVNDLDVLGIRATPGSITITEQGSAGTVGVRLSQMPSSNVVVTAAPGSAGVQVSPSSLTFTPANYATDQSLSVTALMDDDTDGFTTSLTLSATGLANLPVTVVVNDDDSQAILENAASPLVVASGATATFGARLAYRPMSNVTVNVTSMDSAVATVSPGTLTFTNTNWDQNQTVTVTGAVDDDVILNSTVVRLQSGSLVTDVNTNVTDPDVQALTLAGEPATVPEGATASFTVRLAYRPQATTTVNIASSDPAIGVVTPTLTFTTSNYATPQMVTLNAPTDANLVQETSTITVSATGIPSRTFSTMVAEASVITILTSTNSVTVTEQAAGVPFTVTLSNPPTGSLVVTVASNNAGVGFSPATLTFNAGNFSTPQTVTVSGLMDDDVAGITGANLTLTAAGANTATVSVTVVEDDVQSILHNAPNPLTMAENANATFGARLAFRPAATTVVSVASQATGVATVSPGSLSFTTSDWDQFKTVTVTGADDVDTITSTTNVRLQSGTLITDVPVSVTDPDVQGIVLASTDSMITEGSTQTFTVRLAFQPQSNTTVSIGSSDAAVTVNNSPLTFTPGNYATPQTVTLSAPTDVDIIDETATITVSSSGLTSQTFDITVDDQTSITIVPSTTTMSITEQAAGSTFTVTLSNPPVSNLTVNIGTNNANVTRSPTSLVFTAANYNNPQTVTVGALHDDNVVGDSGTLTLSGTGATSATVSVTVNDDDVQSIQESAPATVDVIDPDGSAPVGVTFGVRLAWQPAANTTVNVASLNTGVATVSPASLTFTPSDWSTEKNVTVTAVGDASMADGSTTVRLTATGLTMVDVPVAVDDQDVQVVETSPASTMTVAEAGNATLQVRLKYQPAAATTVSLSSNNADVTVPATLSFTTANYGMYQNATVAAAADSDQINDTATITLTNFDAPSNTTVGVTVTDSTIVETWGWPTTFNPSASPPPAISNAAVIAYRVNFPSMTITAGTLDKYGISGTAGSDFKMAIYTDSGNLPTTLVHSIDTRITATGGFQEVDVTNTPIAAGTYWIAVRASPTMAIGAAMTTPTTTRCSRNITIASLDTAWPLTFGASSCATVPSPNVYFVTYR